MTKKNGRIGKGTQAEVSRFFNGLPVVDAKEPLRVFINQNDIRKAKPKDPTCCVYANACKRLYNSRAILFLRRTAFVDLPNAKGERVVNRFLLNKEVMERIERFDKTGEAHPGGFNLRAPHPKGTLEYVRKTSLERKARIRAGTHKVKPHGPNKRVDDAGDVRTGKGHIHFARSSA